MSQDTLRARLVAAVAEKDELGLSAALADYVAGVADLAFDGAAGEVDLDPDCFAVVDERTVYLPERAGAATTVGASLLERVEDHRAFPMVVSDYVEAIVRRLEGAARRGEVGASIEAYAARSELGAAARERLLDVLGRRRLARIFPVSPVSPVSRPRTPLVATAIPVAAPRKPTMRTQPPGLRPNATPPEGMLPLPRHPTPMPHALAPRPAPAEPGPAPRLDAGEAAPSLAMMSDLPASFVWPPTARETLRGLVALAPATPGEERDGTLAHELDGWSLRTPVRRSFGDGMHGRGELTRLARAHAALGTLGSAHTFLVLAPGSGGQMWIWRVTRVGRSLRALMNEAAARRDLAGLAALLVRYAAAVVEGLALARRGRLVDLAADAFAVEDEVTVYAGDDVVAARGLGAAGQVMLGLLDELEGVGGPMAGAAAEYVAAYERFIPRRLSRADMESMELRRALASASLETGAARDARERLTKLLDGGWAD